MKPSLGLRSSQALALTPQLAQSIRLLQISTAELDQEIEKLMAQNPLLELEYQTPNEEGSPLGEDSGQENQRDNDNLERAKSTESWATPGMRSGRDDTNSEWTTQQAIPKRLQDHLFEQTMTLSLEDRDRAWLEVLIESIDDDGYLRETLDDIEKSIAEAFEKKFKSRLDIDEMEVGLSLLQSMDPTGVGARTLSECLLLQIEKMAHQAGYTLAHRLLSEEGKLEALARREVAELCSALSCTREELKLAQNLIQSCNPRPGSVFQPDASHVVIPDVIAYKNSSSKNSRWHVRLNEAVVPRLSVNPMYADLIKQDRASTMSSQLQEARWMIKNIAQRFDTILRVAQAIAEEQQAFFDQGELAMKPMVLRSIANRCDLHESTVSRVTTNKYMLTPRGTFELKYFFTSSVATDSGGVASSSAIRARLKQWIANEDPHKPFSDQQLAERFAQEGIQVARRTIAKYREALRIEPVSQRKKL